MLQPNVKSYDSTKQRLQTVKQNIRCCWQFHESLSAYLLESRFTSYSEEARFMLTVYTNRRNKRPWSTENTHTIHTVP